MKLASYILLPIVLFMMIGCDNNVANQEDTILLDEQLILAIQTSTSKQAISIEQLPSESKTVLEQEYSDLITVNALIAPELGYEVQMGGKSDKLGERSEVYFTLNGRELRQGRGDKGGEGRDKDSWKCFELVYPVTFVMPDGSTIIVENEAGNGALRSWYEANPDTEEKPELQYPVQISFKGTTETINDDDKMRRAYDMCGGKDKDRDDRDKEKCFDLVYPVTFIMPDGSTITVDDREDWLGVKAWYTDHPDSQERPDLQFPVDIVYRDSTIVTINNDDEMRTAKTDCGHDDDGG